MELWQQIFLSLSEKEEIEIYFPQIPDMESLFNSKCYRALRAIHEAIKDESLSDSECFAKIEEIICVFDGIGSDCGGRHDF